MLNKYICLWGLKIVTENTQEYTNTTKTINASNYDVSYILSSELDFSKIEENQIRDLIVDGFELDHLLSLNYDQLDELFCQYN